MKPTCSSPGKENIRQSSDIGMLHDSHWSHPAVQGCDDGMYFPNTVVSSCNAIVSGHTSTAS